MLRTFSKNIIVAICVFLCSAVVAADMEELKEKQNQLKNQYIELERSNMGYMTKKIELETAKSKLRRLKKSSAAERYALDEMIKSQERSPGIDYSDKIESQRQEWRKVNKLYLSEKEYVRILEDKLARDKIQYKVTQQKIANMQNSINEMVKTLTNAELNRQLSGLRKSQDIKISIVETCSLSVTKDDCIDKARVRAEREAAERGSLVVVDAVTEVKNFNLTKDEVRSRVSARISNIQVFKKTFDLTPDKTGWKVEYGITAKVTPAIHDDMRSQLAQQVVMMFNSGVQFQDVTSRELPEVVDLPPEEEQDFSTYAAPFAAAPYVAPVEVAPVAPAEIIPQQAAQEMLEETEQEMQEIRDVAATQAAKKEEREAQDELDSRQINIMVF